ncbi:hypothetical protein SE23_17150 [Vibrio sinaloensis]|uniref:oligosaccharide flippase family protein n=1 Tax=Photobacterium sp. (strain ATCC 43367) TaxID=379097 RepID=UPI00057F9A60|nr:oligosaccharide flippase family protein [Vibrio sinaloensis]KIE19445.1 hypothetical protein SE23_17150 [Vibrio sinaloensis]
MKRDLLIYLLSEAFVKLMPFLLLPYLTNMLGVDGYADLSIYRSYAAILTIFIGLSAGGSVARYYYRYSLNNIDGLIYVSNFWILFLGLFLYIVAQYFGEVILQMAVVSSTMQGCLTACLSKFQASKNPKKYMLIQVVNVILSTLLTVCLFELDDSSAINRIYSLQLSIFIAITIACPKNKRVRYTWLRFIRLSKYVLFYGLPLTFSSIALALKGNVDRLIIENSISSQELGTISLAMQLGSLLSIAYLIINRAITPYVFERFKFDKRNLNYFNRKQLFFLSIISLIPFFICLLIPNNYLLYIFGKDFIDIKFFLLTYFFSYAPQFFVIILTWKFLYFSYNKYIFFSSALSSAIHVLLVYLAVGYSVYVVPFVVFVSTLFQVFLLLFFSSNIVEEINSK